jgi:hypothetical protein
MSYPAEGGCLCGAVRYRLAAAPIASMHCHCANCRKASGAGVLTWLTVNETDFEWLSGEPERYGYESEHYPAPVERRFCGTCGSQLVWHCLNDGSVDLTAGSLDDPDIIEPQFHVFTRSQVHWLHLSDALPRHETSARADH